MSKLTSSINHLSRRENLYAKTVYSLKRRYSNDTYVLKDNTELTFLNFSDIPTLIIGQISPVQSVSRSSRSWSTIDENSQGAVTKMLAFTFHQQYPVIHNDQSLARTHSRIQVIIR